MLKSLDLGMLVLGRQPPPRIRNAQRIAGTSSGGGRIATQDGQGQSRATQRRNHGNCVGTKIVGQAKKSLPAFRITQRDYRILHGNSRRQSLPVQGTDKLRLTEPPNHSVNLALHAGPGLGARNRDNHLIIIKHAGTQRTRDRMIRTPLQSAGRSPCLRLGAVDNNNFGNCQATLGERAGLVENKVIGMSQCLNGMAARNQYPSCRQRPRGHGKCRWRCQGQCTRATDHQNGNKHPQRSRRIEPPPANRSDERQYQQGTDKPCGKAVGHDHELWLLRRSTFHEALNRRQTSEFANAFDA